jgi:hypothetical protein
MKYNEQKAGGKLIGRDTDDKAKLQATFDKNSKDEKLQALIDSLLDSRAYFPNVIRGVRIWKHLEAEGKEAYRVAHTVLSEFYTGITGDMVSQWINYWDSENRYRLESALSELEANKNEIIESAKNACKPLLPTDFDMDIELEVHIMVDGNRGGLQFDNKIIIDATDGLEFNEFIYTLKHELHHAYYSKWLTEKTAKERKNERYLYWHQRNFIYEGIAQQLDYEGFSLGAKHMFANKELITELFDEWVSLVRDLKGDSAQVAYSAYWESHYENCVARMKKYYPFEITTFANRPSIEYYLSYNIYNSILESGGQEKLKYVIENPDKLLSIYNELHTDSMLVPRIPDDIVAVWKNNL